MSLRRLRPRPRSDKPPEDSAHPFWATAMPSRPRSNRSFVPIFGVGIFCARRYRRSKLERSYWNRSCLSTFTMWIRGPWVIRPRTRFNSQISVPGFQGDRNVEGRCEVKTARNVVTFRVCSIQILVLHRGRLLTACQKARSQLKGTRCCPFSSSRLRCF